MRADERVELAGGRMLMGVALALGALLAAVLPTRHEYARGLDRTPDSQSLPYLEELVRASQGDEPLRRLYVHHLAALGRFEDALAAMGPDRDSRNDGEMANLRFDLLLARARAMPEGSPERAAAFGEVTSSLRVLRDVPQTAGRLRELATVALQLEQPRVAADYLLGLAALSPARERAGVLASAGRWLRASNDGVRASDCYEQAAALEVEPTRAKAYAESAIDALEAQDEVASAADLAASYAVRYPDDPLLIERAAALAGAADRPRAARDFGRRALAFDPDNEERVRLQVRRELAAVDPRAALPLVGRLLTLHPDDPHWRQFEAQVAEWGGDPSLALQDWLWIANRGVDPTPGAVLP